MTAKAVVVRDDPDHPDEGFAALYAELPPPRSLEPWLGWARAARPPVLYLGIGTGRIALPLGDAGIELVGVDAHPGMLRRLRARRPHLAAHLGRIEDLDLGRRFDLVIVPSNILCTAARLDRAAAHLDPGGRRYTQVAQVTLVWPERVEAFLYTAGLRLERLTPSVEGDLAESPSFYVEARRAGP